MIKIYGLICPLTGEIRYIGKTQQILTNRLSAHVSECRGECTSHKTRWLKKFIDMGLRPSIWLLEEVPDGVSWQEREKAWIKRAKEIGLYLTNQTDGGDGVILNSEEAIERHRRNLSAAMHRVRSKPDYKESRSRSAKRSWESSREVIQAAFDRPETKVKQSESKKKTWADPAARERMMNRWTPEAKALQAQRIRERHEKIQAAMTPEVRARQAAKLRETWAKRKAAKA